jgi:hypothetical protein
MRFLREAVEMMPRLVRGLGEEQGARARERWAGLFDGGASAAAALGDSKEALFFLESGRAGTLLESLGGRDLLQSRAVPEALRAVEREARARERAAAAALQRAIGAGDRARAKGCREEFDRAQAGLEEAIARIQREAKAAAELAYGRVDPLDDVRARMRPGEALVLYGPEMALVVTNESARIARLGEGGDLEADAIAPLRLDPGTRRVLVSPSARLSEAAFCLLFPDREVVYVPSGTVYGLLREEAEKRGESVLALGDPDSTKAADPAGAALPALPGTRKEAKAVGDTLLLGSEATKAALLATIAKRPRWRAIHLACHGLVNGRRAQFSSLALAGGDSLTALEVFGASMPADLVVLSACETARGTVYRAEGVMGFVRAFLFAGAPRVIVSLWKVDDEATTALMTRFYELWNPADGSKGLPAATALKRAQEFVAGHARWKDPAHWAAWQLWGLPD